MRILKNGSVCWRVMDREDNQAAKDLLDVARGLRAEDLCEVVTYLIDKGGSEFSYDEELDVFRFSEDGLFAFCEEFADWELLEERGCLDF